MAQNTTRNTKTAKHGIFFICAVACGIGLAACADNQENEIPASTFTVDPALTPSNPQLPGFEDGIPRPLAAVADANGNEADFVENELWLATDDDAELQRFLDTWEGNILLTFDPEPLGLTDLKMQYLVRVSTTSADTSRLVEDIGALHSDRRGDLRVSSESALQLLAAGSQEAVTGLFVGLNWVGRSSDYRNRQVIEAPTGPSGYDTNVFNWPSHNAGSTQDIGVTEA